MERIPLQFSFLSNKNNKSLYYTHRQITTHRSFSNIQKKFLMTSKVFHFCLSGRKSILLGRK